MTAFHQYFFEQPIDDGRTRIFFLNMRNWLLEDEKDASVRDVTLRIVKEDIAVLEQLTPVRTPATNTKEVLVPGDTAVLRYRDCLRDWEQRGWRVDFKALRSRQGDVAFAIVRTQAMFATSIVEYQINERGVHVELEIGAPDLPAFASLMPDEVYQELGNAPRPWPERLAEFFDREFSILGPQGAPLPGRLVEIAPRPRVRRDDVTGEPLAPGEEPTETVIFARLDYAFEGRPDTLTFIGLQSQAVASLGFVVYHEGVAVNDFRYLGRSQKLNLDWDDPWFTRFEIRNLQRANLASMSGFIYVEPYEVRKEIIDPAPLDLQRFVDLGLEGRRDHSRWRCRRS